MSRTDPLAAVEAPDSPRAMAAAWFARAHAGDLSAEDAEALAQWRAADAEHEAEYRVLLGLWDVAGRLPAAALRSLAASPAPAEASAWKASRSPGAVRPRRAAVLALAILFLAVGVGGAALHWRGEQPVFSTALASGRGQHLSETLPDGSRVEANTQTRLEVRLYRDRRVVTLAGGEASFDVAHDDARPFFVDAGAARVRVTGTSFTVRFEGGEARTVVTRGAVEVSGAAAGAGAERVVAGQGTVVTRDGTVAPARTVDVAALTAWREGRIVFADVALTDVLAEVARYRVRPIRLADPALGTLRLSGSFRVDDTDALLAALPLLLPVRVAPAADGGAEISAR